MRSFVRAAFNNNIHNNIIWKRLVLGQTDTFYKTGLISLWSCKRRKVPIIICVYIPTRVLECIYVCVCVWWAQRAQVLFSPHMLFDYYRQWIPETFTFRGHKKLIISIWVAFRFWMLQTRHTRILLLARGRSATASAQNRVIRIRNAHTIHNHV